MAETELSGSPEAGPGRWSADGYPEGTNGGSLESEPAVAGDGGLTCFISVTGEFESMPDGFGGCREAQFSDPEIVFGLNRPCWQD